MQTITRELVRDPVEIVFGDGRRYCTQRWFTRCTDIHDLGGGVTADFGWIKMGEAFPTEDSVSSPFYEPPAPKPWWRRLLGAR